MNIVRRPAWAMVAAIFFAGRLLAGDLYNKDVSKTEPTAPPSPAEVTALECYPAKVALTSLDDAAQLILTAKLAGNRVHDLTADGKYEVANPQIARVTSTGRLIPLANGTTEAIARYGEKQATIAVTCAHCSENLPINFANQIVPIFTKLGCNSGGCHGKASGQNGFKLSLLGFEPVVDFTALVKEGRGRRLLPSSPDNSLLLMKATGKVAHGGGKKLDPDSDEYKLIRRWISAGVPYGKPTDPVVTEITLYPTNRVLTRQGQQQFAAHAHYSDGSVEDITRRAQYESNNTEVAVVDGAGLVRTLDQSGEAAIMTRYQGHVATFRATVPLGAAVPAYAFEARTVVDQHTHNKWKELGLAPSDICSDEEFIRRVSIDLTGTLPTPAQVKAFVADAGPQKREKLIDDLLETSEYSYYFGNKWADILRVKRRQEPRRAIGTFAFHQWICEAIANDKPYDQFASEILTATGDEFTQPTTVWYKELQNPEQFVDDTAQVFLGLRLACAQCHHHPYEKWSQDDYWGIAAFFARVGRKNIPVPGGFQNQAFQDQALFLRSTGAVTNKRTGQSAVMKPLDGEPIKDADPLVDPRQLLTAWLVDAKNPFFARAVANRYWAHFFGRGIVDPLDDMRVTNPPSNPELLDALAKDLVDNHYSLKHLIKTICKSRTYQLSSTPNELNKHDKQNYARHYPRRLTAEVLYDAVCQVTDSPTPFGGLPQDQHAPNRAIKLPDESFSSYFLDVFGRPQRISACECERVGEANLAQALHLLNSDEVQNKLARGGARAETLAKDPRPDAIKVEELVMWAYAHKPTREQSQAALEHLAKNAQNKKLAYENLIWTLINTKEFQFNH